MSTSEIIRRRAMLGAVADYPITTEKNADLMEWVYSKGYAANADYMTMDECLALTGTFNGFAANTSFEYAEEFAYFSNKTNMSAGSGLVAGNNAVKAVCMPNTFSSFGSNAGVIWGCTAKPNLVLPYVGVVGYSSSSVDNIKNYVTGIYVSDAYINDYKAHAKWGQMSDKILPISTYVWHNDEVRKFLGLAAPIVGGVVKHLYFNNLCRHYGERMAA